MSLHNFYEGAKDNFVILKLGSGTRDLGLLFFGSFFICKAHFGVLKKATQNRTHNVLTHDPLV